MDPFAGRCGACRRFTADPHALTAALAGLSILSSASASVRARDGLCRHHDRLVGAAAACADFAAGMPQTGKS